MNIPVLDSSSKFTSQVTEFDEIIFRKSSDQKRQKSTGSKETMAYFQTPSTCFFRRERRRKHEYVAYDSNFCLKKVTTLFSILKKMGMGTVGQARFFYCSDRRLFIPSNAMDSFLRRLHSVDVSFPFRCIIRCLWTEIKGEKLPNVQEPP